VDLANSLQLVSTLGVALGLWFAGWQVRLAQRQRTREAALQLVQSLQTVEFASAYPQIIALPDGLSKAEIERRLGDRMPALLFMCMAFESIGILVHRREIPIEVVEDFFTAPILVGWRKLQVYAADMRQEAGMDTPLEFFQWLAERVSERRQQTPTPPAYEQFRAWRA
jgi:proline dehydrogenase